MPRIKTTATVRCALWFLRIYLLLLLGLIILRFSHALWHNDRAPNHLPDPPPVQR